MITYLNTQYLKYIKYNKRQDFQFLIVYLYIYIYIHIYKGAVLAGSIPAGVSGFFIGIKSF